MNALKKKLLWLSWSDRYITSGMFRAELCSFYPQSINNFYQYHLWYNVCMSQLSFSIDSARSLRFPLANGDEQDKESKVSHLKQSYLFDEI